jgi:hypothetical protein
MKKGLLMAFSLVMLLAGLQAEDKAVLAGNQPLMIQSAFYTPTYQCFYMKGSDEMGLKYTPGAWCTYAAPITKDTITYDGIAGTYKNLNVIRIKSNTKKPAEELVIYIDNVTVTDGSGKAIMTLDFEDGTNAGVYCCQGRPLAENTTIVTKDGHKCFLLHMKSENMYGYNGVEVQWTLPARTGGDTPTWDFTKGDYSVKFDYLIAVK